MDNTVYTIGEVLDINSNKRKERFFDIIGKKVKIILLEEDKNMILSFEDEDNVMRSTTVSEIDQTDYGFWVTTKNSMYRLDIDAFYK